MVQMLQHYPNLLTSQAPPPLTEAEFSSLPSVTVSRAALGMHLMLDVITDNSVIVMLKMHQHSLNGLFSRTKLVRNVQINVA